MNIYDMLKSGMSQDEIMSFFEKECAEAKATLEKEAAEEKKEALMAEGRAHTINAIVAYMKAFGEPDPTDEEIREIEAQIKELEEGLVQMARLYSLSKSAPKQEVKVTVSKDAEETAAAIRRLVRGMI